MYKGHSLWDQEQERLDDYASNESGDKGPDYHAQEDYNAGGASQSDAYDSGHGKEEEKKKDEAKGIEKSVVDQEKKYDKKEVTAEDIKVKAASDVHQKTKSSDDTKKKKKEHKSIEDAINKAMKDEKEVIYVDD